MVRPAEVNSLLIVRKSDWAQEFRLKQSDGVTAVDLTGATSEFELRSTVDDSVVITASGTISTPTTGVITVNISDTITTALDVGRYKSRLRVTVGTITDTYLYGVTPVI